MKKYASYIKEREDLELIESENGFMAYAVYPELDYVYLAEIFIEKEYRGSLQAYRLFQKCKIIARNNYCNNLIGSVDVTTRGYLYSESLMKRLGFVFERKVGNLLFYKLKLVKL